MRRIILLVLHFISLAASAYSPDWQKAAVAIDWNSPFQKEIDRSFETIFQSPVKKILCSVTYNPNSLIYSLGISPHAALRIGESCNYTDKTAGMASKVMPKKYFVAPIQDPRLESWTDLGNRTYLFVDGKFNSESLTRALLHEAAIAFDAKNRMLYSGYFRYSGKRNIQAGGITIIDMGSFDEEELRLRDAFNLSATSNIATTFATIRAFQFEDFATNDFKMLDHNACVARFKETFEVVKDFKEYNHSTELDQIQLHLANLFDSKVNDKSDAEMDAILKNILSEDIRIEDQGRDVSFCQYMATPLLTGRTLYTFFSSGPRPRLTGSTGGQGQGAGQTKTTQETGFSLANLFKTKPKKFLLSDPENDVAIQQKLSELGIQMASPLPSEQSEQSPLAK